MLVEINNPRPESTVVNAVSFGATGDGTTNDTAAVQAALNAASGKAVFLPSGTYKITAAGLTLPSDVALIGAGKGLTTLLSASASSNESVIDASSAADSQIRDLTIDGDAQDNLLHGILGSDSLTVERVHIKDVRHSTTPADTYAGIRCTTAGNVRILDCEIVDCNIGVKLHDSTHEPIVRGCLIESPGDHMVDGVFCTASSEADRSVLIEGNTIRNAQADPSENGVDGHGIKLYRHRNARVIGNHCSDCNTSGILVGVGSAGSQIQGNVCMDNLDAVEGRGTGIYVETDGSNATIQTDTRYGTTISGNTCSGSYTGICVSYAPATIVTNNICHTNEQDGIQNDSERVVLTGNVCFNNNQDGDFTPLQAQPAGIRNYGVSCIINGNICYDNQTVKTQLYGISTDNDATQVWGNSLAGNATAGFWAWQDGSNNTGQYNLGDQPSVTGDTESNAALESLITALEGMRLISDDT